MTQHSYEIRVEGHLGDSWIPWFEGMAIRHTESGETVLTGTLADETALHGVLMKIRDLGLPLVAVNRTERTGSPNLSKTNPVPTSVTSPRKGGGESIS